MKRIVLFIASITLLLSYSDRNMESQASSTPQKAFPFQKNQHPTFREWNKYYLSRKSGFKNTDFIVSPAINNEFPKGTIYATFNKEFDRTYLPFLVYSPNKEQYVDFNSYHWTLVDGEPQFEVDQEINLVDTENKTIRRIAFCGSEELVEDVYWQDENTVILLKMIEGNTPQITSIDLKAQTSKSYTSVYKLDSPSEYSKMRIRSGIKI